MVALRLPPANSLYPSGMEQKQRETYLIKLAEFSLFLAAHAERACYFSCGNHSMFENLLAGRVQ